MAGSRPLSQEDRLIGWLRERQARAGSTLIGDDAALLPSMGGRWALTVDQQIAGVHFPERIGPRAWARRLLAVNLSDLAAVGAEPAYALVALTLPPGVNARPFLDALDEACRKNHLELAGGDLARGERRAAALTLLGTLPRGARWVRRSNARPGDILWVGGTLGESALGRELLARGAGWRAGRPTLPAKLGIPARLRSAARAAIRRHLEPTPQLDLGRWLRRRRRAAAIDVSDGLALDLHRLCDASGVGAILDRASLQTPEGFEPLRRHFGLDADALTLGGGEDYVLLFTVPPGVRPPERSACARIGSLRKGSGVDLEHRGRRRPLPATGWDHLAP